LFSWTLIGVLLQFLLLRVVGVCLADYGLSTLTYVIAVHVYAPVLVTGTSFRVEMRCVIQIHARYIK